MSSRAQKVEARRAAAVRFALSLSWALAVAVVPPSVMVTSNALGLSMTFV